MKLDYLGDYSYEQYQFTCEQKEIEPKEYWEIIKEEIEKK